MFGVVNKLHKKIEQIKFLTAKVDLKVYYPIAIFQPVFPSLKPLFLSKLRLLFCAHV
jgi:hypothetical protein